MTQMTENANAHTWKSHMDSLPAGPSTAGSAFAFATTDNKGDTTLRASTSGWFLVQVPTHLRNQRWLQRWYHFQRMRKTNTDADAQRV